jgi:predicted RNA-binding protein with PIN domain
MPYLIDGANVMAQKREWREDMGRARKDLIRELAALVAYQKVKVKVIFDGPSDADYPEGSTYKSVKIFYARPGSDADTRIQNMIRRSSHNRDTTVVTSDKALGSFCRRHGAKVLSSGEFRKLLAEANEWKLESERLKGLSSVDVDEWLNFFESRVPDK